eukprot:Lithocolla_globosa_v1_NODE_4294_length_1469_cov_17.815417.p4 type:complete len:133 gc:universal NODE_4294_length_1469_cov_17.815417:892-494(-)
MHKWNVKKIKDDKISRVLERINPVEADVDIQAGLQPREVVDCLAHIGLVVEAGLVVGLAVFVCQNELSQQRGQVAVADLHRIAVQDKVPSQQQHVAYCDERTRPIFVLSDDFDFFFQKSNRFESINIRSHRL